MRLFILLLLVSLTGQASILKKYNELRIKSIYGNGGMDGGGTGAERAEEGAAWFYIDKPFGHIKVCYKIGKTFKASESEINDVIQKSFKTWDDYLLKNKIYEKFDSDGNEIPYPEYLKIATKIKIEDCNKDTELVFYFGEEDKKVSKILDGMKKDTHGFAYRDYKDIDPIKGTSKGMIWIFDPTKTLDISDDQTFDWSKKELLQAIVNHEVGHVMGAKHQDNTIMESDLSTLFSFSQMTITPEMSNTFKELVIQSKKNLKKINHQSQLVYDSSKFSLEGVMGLNGSKSEKENFKFFMQREPKGKVKIKLTAEDELEKAKFLISDDNGSKEFVAKIGQPYAMSVRMSQIGHFKRIRKLLKQDGPNHTISEYDSDEHVNFGATILSDLVIENFKTIKTIFDIGPTLTAYFEKGSSRSSIVGNSNFTIHYIGDDKQPKTMFIENIIDFSNMEINHKKH